MRVVVDTNVIVSGILNPYGASSTILRLILNKRLEIALDSRIISEYKEVLKRPKFPFTSNQIDDLLDYIYHIGFKVVANPIDKSLPDPNDNMFLEVALSSNAEIIITGDKRHFPQRICGKIKVVNPKEFLEIFLKNKQSQNE